MPEKSIKLDKRAVARRLVAEIQRVFGTQIALAKAMGAKDSTGLTPYVKGKCMPGNVMQKKLRDAGLDVDYIMYGREENAPNSERIEACKQRMSDMQAKISEISKELKEISAIMNEFDFDDESGKDRR